MQKTLNSQKKYTFNELSKHLKSVQTKYSNNFQSKKVSEFTTFDYNKIISTDFLQDFATSE